MKCNNFFCALMGKKYLGNCLQHSNGWDFSECKHRKVWNRFQNYLRKMKKKEMESFIGTIHVRCVLKQIKKQLTN